MNGFLKKFIAAKSNDEIIVMIDDGDIGQLNGGFDDRDSITASGKIQSKIALFSCGLKI